jgi:undecaprenyl-diphosphatase
VSIFEAIVLGTVQGLTEFLPISSTGHLRIVPAFLGWEDPGAAFTAVTQLGTMAAVLLYFRHELWRIARAWTRSLTRPEARREHDARLGWYILLGTIPIGIFGFAFRDQIESGARDLYLIGTTLIVLGFVLLYAEHVARRDRAIEDIRRRDGILIGCAQALALVPGVSRSGATIAGALLMGCDKRSAAEFSFFLAIPTMLGAATYDLWQNRDGLTADGGLVIAVGFLAAFAAALFVVRWFIGFVGRHGFAPFAWYRIALGGALLVALQLR